MSTVSALRTILDEHRAVDAMLRSMRILADDGPKEERARFFETLRGMLFYMDEFPERRHHPNENRLLFPMLLRVAPELQPVIDKLEVDHHAGEGKVRELQHLLVAWEFVGDSRQAEFVEALHKYVRFYLQHMHTEETQLLPVAQQRLTDEDRAALDAAFEDSRDPLAGGHRDAVYERLFSRIVAHAPTPVGFGQA